jgi:hypothetical protein
MSDSEPASERPEIHNVGDLVKCYAKIIDDAKAALENIVCVKDPDRGVVLLSNDGPTHYDAEAKCEVYDHENFSPLGDALIALHGILSGLSPPAPAAPQADGGMYGTCDWGDCDKPANKLRMGLAICDDCDARESAAPQAEPTT